MRFFKETVPVIKNRNLRLLKLTGPLTKIGIPGLNIKYKWNGAIQVDWSTNKKYGCALFSKTVPHIIIGMDTIQVSWSSD